MSLKFSGRIADVANQFLVTKLHKTLKGFNHLVEMDDSFIISVMNPWDQ